MPLAPSFALPVLTAPTLAAAGASTITHSDATTWLRHALGGPTWLHLPGEDASRCRVITTLLHGNEPSGVLALHRWLGEAPRPRVSLAILVANVAAALAPPIFTHRIAPGGRDLNRCFRPPFGDASGELARRIAMDIAAWAPECVIDLHNTSGSGPAFAVALARDPAIERLASHFCDRLIVSDFRLGSLMELPLTAPTLADCPIFTLECGGARDPAALEVAADVYRRLGDWPDLAALTPAPGLEVLIHPLRVELRPGASLAYARGPEPGADITLWARIDTCNRGITDPTTCLGWLGEGGLRYLQAVDARGSDRLGELLCARNGRLYPRRPLRLFMATTNAEIARSDCLFYAVPE
ncbi:succinylglutamate desuccinylase/aspartoacylase family protein [Halomonas sp. YLGW01]|uniref:succinylglutamate desuccinylase/aspartoacylase domain-containing protein n=1 Tax=Halomonas sp. YLGW01 TaxID=2773308 RepID=UPI0017860249|nr:succinylglutamate desuccinylase/aspartoacylase family protein [Halomonas sp. YLGW01]